jgi:hypothetical protein
MEDRLKRSNFRNYNRLDAVDGRNMTIDDVKRVVSESTLTFLGKHPQTIGSYLLFSAISLAPDIRTSSLVRCCDQERLYCKTRHRPCNHRTEQLGRKEACGASWQR